MSSPIRIDLNAEQVAAMQEDMFAEQVAAMQEDMFATLTTAHIEELCALRTDAKLAAETFSEAIRAQAEKCGLSRSALRKYICARVDDRLDALDTEANDLSHLLETAK